MLKWRCTHFVGLAVMAMLASSHATAAWLSAKEFGGIAYFLYEDPPSIERYALSSRDWLASIPLSDTPAAFAPGASGLYIAYGSAVARRNLDGSDETPLFEADNAVRHLAVDGNLVFVQSGARTLTSVDAEDGAALDSLLLANGIDALIAAPGLRRLFMHGTSNALRLGYAEYSAAGILSTPVAWPHNTSELRPAPPLFLDPEESLLMDRTGAAFDTGTLSYAGSFGGTLTAVAPFGNEFAVLRNQLLFLYGPDLLVRGMLILPEVAHVLFVDGSDALAFSHGDGSAAGIAVSTTSLIDFPTLAFEFFEDTPSLDTIFLRDGVVDENGIAYINFGGDGAVFRLFDTHTQQFVANFRMPIGAYMMRPDIAGRRIYTATQDGAFFYIDLDDPTELIPLFNIPYNIADFAVADGIIFANTLIGFTAPMFRTYDLEGNALFHNTNGNLASQYHTWDPVRRRMYFLGEFTSEARLRYVVLGEDGAISNVVASGAPAEGSSHPVRVSPDGERILLGSGRIHEAEGLAAVGNLPNPILEAIWIDGVPFTLANVDDSAQVQRWSGDDFEPDGTLDLPRVAVGMRQSGDNLLVTTQDTEGRSMFMVSPDLAIIPPPVLTHPADINADGVVNALDVQLVINAALGIAIDFDADVNGDGVVNAVDVQQVINAALGIES